MWQYSFQLLLLRLSAMLLADMLVTQPQQAFLLCPGSNSLASWERLVARVGHIPDGWGKGTGGYIVWHGMGSASPFFLLCWAHILARETCDTL